MKLKTKKSIAKRFKITKKGKILFRRAGKSHLLTKKLRRFKRHLKKEGLILGKAAKKIIKRALPYR